MGGGGGGERAAEPVRCVLLGKLALNLTLQPGESTTFRHRVAIDLGVQDDGGLDRRFKDWAASYGPRL